MTSDIRNIPGESMKDQAEPVLEKRKCRWCEIEYWIAPGQVHGCIDGGEAQRAELLREYEEKQR